MKVSNKVALVALVAALGFGFQGCKKKGPSSAADAASQGSSGSGSESGSGMGTNGFNSDDINSYTTENIIENLHLVNIYFDFDQSSISEKDRQFLKVLAEALNLDKNKKIAVKIQGNCDERGSNEYNLALGERRARSVNDYLANLGVAKNRLDVVSFGEEKPADTGSSESAWAKNRRASFEATK